MKKFRRLALLIGIVFLLLIFYIIPRKIQIKQIVCESQLGTCSERIQSILATHIGENIHEVKKSIQNDLSLTTKDDTIVVYRYPSTLFVSIYETQPEFALKQKEGDSFRLVDNQGYVVSEAQETILPFAIINSDLPQVGTKLDDSQIFALTLLKDLSKSYQLSEGSLSEEGLLVTLPTKVSILFPLEGDRDVILGSFILVINQLNSVKEGSTMEKVNLTGKIIDLRFKNPVIR